MNVGRLHTKVCVPKKAPTNSSTQGRASASSYHRECTIHYGGKVNRVLDYSWECTLHNRGKESHSAHSITKARNHTVHTSLQRQGITQCTLNNRSKESHSAHLLKRQGAASTHSLHLPSLEDTTTTVSGS